MSLLSLWIKGADGWEEHCSSFWGAQTHVRRQLQGQQATPAGQDGNWRWGLNSEFQIFVLICWLPVTNVAMCPSLYNIRYIYEIMAEEVIPRKGDITFSTYTTALWSPLSLKSVELQGLCWDVAFMFFSTVCTFLQKKGVKYFSEKCILLWFHSRKTFISQKWSMNFNLFVKNMHTRLLGKSPNTFQ